MTNVESTPRHNTGGSGKKHWRKRRRRRGPKAGPDFAPEVEGPTETVCGVLELHRDRSGWLRKGKNNYLPAEEPERDVYVPPGLVSQHGLMDGNEITGLAGIPGKGAPRMTLATIEGVDGLLPEESRKR